MEGERSIRRVLATTGTVEEGLKPSGRVAASVSAVAKQGERSDGGVLGANGVAKERLVADGRVAATLCVAKKGEGSVGRVAVADSVAKECPCAGSRIFSCGVQRSEPAPTPVQKLPSVRLRSEYIPIAVLW